MDTSYKLIQLSNGLRVAWLPYRSAVSYAGVILNVGSAHELPEQYGMAHYIEHLLFKGTKKRTSHQIINYLETVGGELNAFTTKEETTIYSAFPKQFYRRAIDLICDITFRSSFPEKELENERNVILDEISSYKDTPSENIFDEFDERFLKGHPAAHNILGTEDSLGKMERTNINEFWQNHYHSGEPVFFFMGDISFDQVVKQVEKNTDFLKLKKKDAYVGKLIYTPKTEYITEETYQAHFITGMPTFGYKHQDKVPLLMLSNLLGGSSMNSRLNMSLREKNGIAYNVESTFQAYSDIGTLTIYFGTDEKNLKKSKSIVYRELDKLRSTKLTESKLRQLKAQFYGQIAVGSENKENVFLNFGKNILRHNRYAGIEEIHLKIENTSADKLQELAILYLNPKNYSSLTIL